MARSLGAKRPVREADDSPPSSVEVKECMGLYLQSPNTPSWRGAQLKKQAQGQIYLLSPYIISVSSASVASISQAHASAMLL
jgi:hypothetical protein